MNTAPLPFQPFQREFLASLRDPHRSRAPRGVPTERWRVYRELLYNKIDASLAACFPISRALLGPRAQGWRSALSVRTRPLRVAGTGPDDRPNRSAGRHRSGR